MPLQLSQFAQNCLLQVVPALIDSSGGAGTLELFTQSNVLLARLFFSQPSANEPSDGTISFKPITPGLAQASGKAEVARIKSSDGSLIFECDVSSENGGGTIKLDTTNLVVGGPIKITEFRLTTGEP
jgi:hypothetical protein